MKKRGKKIDVITIEEGTERREVELRWEKATGEFLGELDGETLSAPSSEQLKRKLEERLKQLTRYEYKWYLVVKFAVNSTGGSFYHRHEFTAEELQRQEKITAFSFDFHVAERSKPTKLNAHQTAFMERPVREEDGELEAVGRPSMRYQSFSDGETVIEYTPERYQKLVAIRAAMKVLALQLHAIVGGKAEAVTSILDGLRGAPLQLAAKSDDLTESTVEE